jgi:eukaryotic-like serine/threonine-protein kinase
MNKSKFLWADVAIGAIVSLLVFGVFKMDWADGVEAKLYDARAKMRAASRTSDKVVIVGIDDDSTAKLGRYPWPRNYMAEMVDQLTEAGAEVVGVDVLYSDAELNPGLNKIQDLAKIYEAKAAEKNLPKTQAAAATDFSEQLKKAAAELDNDEKFAGSLAFSTKAVLPMYFKGGQAIGKREKRCQVAGTDRDQLHR